MKLLSYTSRIQLVFFLILFGVFSVLFFLILSWNVLQNVDEVLFNRKMNLLTYLEENPRVPFAEDKPLDDFTFYPIDQRIFQKGKEIYSDTLVYEPVDDELDEYRKLTAHVELHGNLQVPQPFLAKLLKELSGKGVISSNKGPGGGFFLDEKNLNNTLWDIISSIDGAYKFDDCFLGLSKCNNENPCPVHHIVSPFKEEILRNFRGKSIAVLAAEMEQNGTVISLKGVDL